jgi:ApaG protein
VPSAITNGIRVEVTTKYLPAESNPRAGQFVFAYTIEISNETERTVQLKRRHWHILHGDGHHEEVKGEGVVGEQPVLAPGTGFRYTSGCVLRTPHGTMHGSYQLVDADGGPLEVRIPPFTLSAPHALN